MHPILVIMEKEMRIFLRDFYSEIVWAILFPALFVFGMNMGLGEAEVTTGGIPYLHYIVPGMIAMTVANSALYNTSFDLFFEKEVSNALAGVLMCPVELRDIVLAKVLSGAVRSMLTGSITVLMLALATGRWPANPLAVTAVLFSGALVFATVGVILGAKIRRGYKITTAGNLLLLPLLFLGGAFFDLKALPGSTVTLLYLSPVTLWLEGLKNSYLYGSGAVWVEIGGNLLFFAAIWVVANRVFRDEVVG